MHTRLSTWILVGRCRNTGITDEIPTELGESDVLAEFSAVPLLETHCTSLLSSVHRILHMWFRLTAMASKYEVCNGNNIADIEISQLEY